MEQALLRHVDLLLSEAARDVADPSSAHPARFAVLEEVAGRYAGWDPRDFRHLTGQAAYSDDGRLAPWAEKVLTSVRELPIPVPLALSALSREALAPAKQRVTGAYNTDWRLAQTLAASSVGRALGSGLWVDPACGTGMLLTAAALAVPAGEERDAVVRDLLCGADLSPLALRGACLSVASLTSNLGYVAAFRQRLFHQDSLREVAVWRELAPDGAGLVIANPPWERLKATRHELATRHGVTRHYGQRHGVKVDLSVPRAELLAYVGEVAGGMRLQDGGEHDLYKLFLELGLGLAAEGGMLAMLLPAGLIRAQGTRSLRRELFSSSSELDIAVIENRQRHFAIDSRFKFVSVVARAGEGVGRPLALRVADRTGALPDTPVHIDRAELMRVRPDLSLPEVRTEQEWSLYAALTRRGVTVGDTDGPWRPIYCRELDMTNDQRHFRRYLESRELPVVEGRHVSQFRYRAKRYVSGEGRAARWAPQRLEAAEMGPQWFIGPDRLRAAASLRTKVSRVGFCDITGQTNERTLHAARIPAGVVCGNKVPTVAFSEGTAGREDLFLALANSLTVDWMLRRTVTTTVNFFVLNSLPLPAVDVESPEAVQLIELARHATAAEGAEEPDLWQLGQSRARMDALVAKVWGLSLAELKLVLSDFPLLDRGQPALVGEVRSTVTVDCVLTAFVELMGEPTGEFRVRAELAQERGALPYIPAEYV